MTGAYGLELLQNFSNLRATDPEITHYLFVSGFAGATVVNTFDQICQPEQFERVFRTIQAGGCLTAYNVQNQPVFTFTGNKQRYWLINNHLAF